MDRNQFRGHQYKVTTQVTKVQGLLEKGKEVNYRRFDGKDDNKYILVNASKLLKGKTIKEKVSWDSFDRFINGHPSIIEFSKIQLNKKYSFQEKTQIKQKTKNRESFCLCRSVKIEYE